MYTINTFNATDNKKIYYYQWRETAPYCNINFFIIHGMAEHAARYNEFAEYLSSFGIRVYALDLRGHGSTAKDDIKGYFAPSLGWLRVCLDIFEFKKSIKADKSVKNVIFGHSMGSYIAKSVISLYPKEFDACVLSGTGYPNAIIKLFGRPITLIDCLINGKKNPSHLMNCLSFSSFNKKFEKDGDTGFEWLNSNQKEVEKYVNDKNCGFVCTSLFFYDFIRGMLFSSSKACIKEIKKDLPILFVSGSDDPVGSFKKGVLKSAEVYKNIGIKDVRTIFYDNKRHEILLEDVKDDVYRDIKEFVFEVFK